ncbi:hypothetical protein AVEN_268861-1 [Araneus ventricosus]|uniref:Uncharacterized protein n=1 Tax=Araneus ventricosus TaxID=182803 RepID=A0A4Y2EVR2_ARAVE|nr:hypothetical protein AVEN_268861-1 [Araneus ventricosus]
MRGNVSTRFLPNYSFKFHLTIISLRFFSNGPSVSQLRARSTLDFQSWYRGQTPKSRRYWVVESEIHDSSAVSKVLPESTIANDILSRRLESPLSKAVLCPFHLTAP